MLDRVDADKLSKKEFKKMTGLRPRLIRTERESALKDFLDYLSLRNLLNSILEMFVL